MTFNPAAVQRFTDGQLAIIRFCAIECSLQRSGENSVAWMLNAWEYARGRAEVRRPDVDDILMIGRLVEPDRNAAGFRQVGVRVGWDVKGDWRDVPRQIEQLCAMRTVDSAEWFRQYEEIHPFVDGNGRSGVILFCWLAGILDDPDWPPNFWGDERRIPGAGAPR